MTVKTSYPAAHSMDTEWFAIDAKGHVALFDTDEAGSMPVHAPELELTHLYFWGLFAELGPADEDGIIWRSEGDPLELIPSLTLNLEQLHGLLSQHLHSANAQEPLKNLLCVMRDQDAARRLVCQGRIADERALGLVRHPYPAVLMPQLLVTPLLDAITRGEVLGADAIRSYANESLTSLLGVHVYEYPSYSRVPYQRAGVPHTPLMVEQLPESLRARLLQMRLNADFSQDEQVNPSDSFECEWW